MKNPDAVGLGSIKTKKKARSSRKNGKKGGHPFSYTCPFCNTHDRSLHKRGCEVPRDIVDRYVEEHQTN